VIVFTPLQSPVATQLVALVLDQVIVTDPPAVTDCGTAETETFGAGVTTGVDVGTGVGVGIGTTGGTDTAAKGVALVIGI
jgi:hypothetical protein